jgi:hypothetical protein|eukprot:2867905-Prymnesium_polylepis.1
MPAPWCSVGRSLVAAIIGVFQIFLGLLTSAVANTLGRLGEDPANHTPYTTVLTFLGVLDFLPAVICIVLKMLFQRDRKALSQLADASSETTRLNKQQPQPSSQGRDVEYGTGAAAAPLSAAAAPLQDGDVVCGTGGAAAPLSAAAAPSQDRDVACGTGAAAAPLSAAEAPTAVEANHSSD